MAYTPNKVRAANVEKANRKMVSLVESYLEDGYKAPSAKLTKQLMGIALHILTGLTDPEEVKEYEEETIAAWNTLWEELDRPTLPWPSEVMSFVSALTDAFFPDSYYQEVEGIILL